MARSLCDRCLQPTARGLFTIWRGCMVRVGQDCYEAIQREKAATAAPEKALQPGNESRGSGGG